jgi:hypothetical protein
VTRNDTDTPRQVRHTKRCSTYRVNVLEPIGPLPPEIYWRRRALAIGVAVVVVVLFVWLISSLGGGDSPETANTAVTADVTVPSAAPTSAAIDTGVPGQNNTDSTAGTQSSAATTNGQPVAAPPGQCPDQSLAVKATVEHPTYRVGEKPKFGLVITNIGTTQCERDLGAGQQLFVYTIDGAMRLWSNTDCYPPTDPLIKSLKPGEQALYSVDWSGTTSQPDCQGDRVAVAPGAYTVVAQLGAVKSTPEPFNIG